MAGNLSKEERLLAKQERIKAFAAELLAMEEEESGGDFRTENINDIEDTMIRMGDAMAREVGVQKLARHTDAACQQAPCPRCGNSGQLVKKRARELLTARGPVPVTEAKYHCPKCRRNFFPSDGPVGN